MKRNNEGIPLQMVQRWKRPPPSCQLCRMKKLRCDRTQPCANCTLRKSECMYAGQDGASPKKTESSSPQAPNLTPTPAWSTEPSPPLAPGGQKELLSRIRKLEEAVFDKIAHASPEKSHDGPSSAAGTPMVQKPSIEDLEPTSYGTPKTPFRGCFPLPPTSIKQTKDGSSDMSYLLKHLPLKVKADELYKHFSQRVHLTLGVFHHPSTHNLLEQTYQKVLVGEDPDRSSLLLLFCIFASACFGATARFLQTIGFTKEKCMADFEIYTCLALSIVKNTPQPIAPSTVAFQGLISLLNLLANTEGFTDKTHILRMRAMNMARTMQIHRLDTAKNKEQRRLQGHSTIDAEIQRRIWWNMVSTDWLLSFTGGPQEGTYIFHPNHMKVNYPKNVDDDFITAFGEDYDLPLSVPTTMTATICRIKFADLCREVVDRIPSILLDTQDIDYDIVLSMDAKFQECLKELPSFFQLDPASIQQSQEICRERPFIPWQRIVLHFGINTRICRLHRPFHCASPGNPRFAFSRTASIRAAQMVMDLCRSMDEVSEVGEKLGRSWMLMQHVFLAAITLATDVSLNPTAPYASVHKSQVLAACRMLERSQQDSATAKQAIQKGVHTLMSMIQNQSPLISSTQRSGFLTLSHDSYNGAHDLPPLENVHTDKVKASRGTSANEVFSSSLPLDKAQERTGDHLMTGHDNTVDNSLLADFGEQDWDYLWSEFFNAAPEWGTPQWNSLMEGIDLNLGPTLS